MVHWFAVFKNTRLVDVFSLWGYQQNPSYIVVLGVTGVMLSWEIPFIYIYMGLSTIIHELGNPVLDQLAFSMKHLSFEPQQRYSFVFGFHGTLQSKFNPPGTLKMGPGITHELGDGHQSKANSRSQVANITIRGL